LAGELLDTLGTRADATIALDDRAWAETLLGLQSSGRMRGSSRPRRSCARCG
jgi:hypothetical protein